MKSKKILSLLFGGILIPFIMGFSGYNPGKKYWIDANPLEESHFSLMNYNGDDSVTAGLAAIDEQKAKRFYKHFSSDKILSDESSVDSEEEFAQHLIEQALTLCQISHEYWYRGELDRAIKLLDQAYSLMLGIDTCENEYLIQQKEDLRFTISKRINEIYASRKIVLNEGKSEIQVQINEQVQKEIDLYTTGRLRNHFIGSYKKSGKYRQMILDMLEVAGLPKELSWLPLIESGFRVRALSSARALGLWQFIPSTGYKFGLNRNRYIDERLNPAKSTRAAIDYLKELHGHFGDWSTALAAYNCGETRVLRAIQKQKINYLDNFWDLYALLPEETARYVPKFFAILHIVNNLEKYGLEDIKIDSPLKFETMTVAKKISLEDAAEITGIDREILEELNPELRQKIIPGGKYGLHIPEGIKHKLLANIDQIIHLNPAGLDFVKHRVRYGETLSLIARRYRTSVDNIMLANDLNRANLIVAGETLKIPRKANSSL